MKEKVLNSTVLRCVLVGIVNTLVGTAIMFGLYNLAHCSYWISSASNYILTSVLSFFLNKIFTFQNKEKDVRQIARFAVNIAICYLLAYGIARPLCIWMLSEAPQNTRDNISMFIGMCLFTAANYFGQRFFAFKAKSYKTNKTNKNLFRK